MTSGLNQQPGSKPAGALVAIILASVLCCVGFPSNSRGLVQGKQPPAVLRIVPNFQPNAKEAEWILEDSLWLGQQSHHQQPAPIEGPLDAEAVQLWKSWVRKSAVSTPDSMLLARTAASRLRDRWLHRGYFAAGIRTHLAALDSNLALGLPDTLVLDPGGAFRLGVLDLSGDDFAGRSHLVKTWLPRSGDLFRPDEFDRAVNRLLSGAGDAGYPFARWSTNKLELHPATATVDVTASLLPGTKSYIGILTSDLPQGRGQAFLFKSSGIVPGQLFNNSDLEQARQRLIGRDLYSLVDIPVVYTTTARDTVGIHFPVKPRLRSNHLQVVLGLSRPADGGKAKISGEIDLRLPNMAGTGRALQVGWQDDGVRKSRFGFQYLEPLALGTPLDTEIYLAHEVESESFTIFSLDNRWRLQVVKLWGIELGVGWDRSTYPVGAWVSSSRTRARGAFFHRRGDRTRSGWSSLFAIENAWRSSTGRLEEEEESAGSNPSQSRLGESLTQQIYEMDSAGELFMGTSWSLFGRASFRQLSGSAGEVPLSEQFRFGGAASLRGYREDEFHGSRAAWASLEMRIGRPGGSRLYTFYDLGYFAFSAAGADPEDPAQRVLKEGWPKGFGLGILAKTPGGDISLAVGFPGTVDFDLAKLHVTLLESF